MAWWDEAIGYELYLRSFADGDGDGIGDFVGLAAKLGYIAGIGVDAVWVTPFYPSPQADFGYDVSDYAGVDPVYGSMGDFDRFVEEAHRLDLKVIVDVVPNHTSSRHPFFEAALAGGPGSRYWDYYIWRDPAPDGGPPNNWFSVFGGTAWTYVRQHAKYYLHLFLPEQPDLNWENPAVRKEFEAILRFWIDRGVDGFRIDVAHALIKDQTFGDDPPMLDLDRQPVEFDDLEHLYDLDQPAVTDVYEEWRAVVGPDIFLIGEVYILDPKRVTRYVTGTGLNQSFYFGLNLLDWDPANFVSHVRAAADAVPSGWGWIQGTHDIHRAATRFGGGQLGLERSLTLWLGLMGLPGTPFLYQGEELGLSDGIVAPADVVDPLGKWKPELGRDPARTPMPWTTGPHHGFTTSEPWLRSEARSDEETVEYQDGDPGSALNTMRALIAVRRETSSLRTGPVVWIDAPPAVLAYTRDGVAHLANLDDEPGLIDVPGRWEIRHQTGEAELRGRSIQLGARSGVILVRLP